MRTIIVDDERLSRSVLKLLLEKHCPSVTVVAVCADGLSALEAINKYQPELLFLDVEMPGLNGFEVINACGHINTAIIVTTSHEEYALQAIRHNVVDFLMKPILRDDLQDAVDKALVRQAHLTEKGKSLTRSGNNLELLHQQLHPGERLGLPSPEGVRMILVKDILYCMADGINTRMHLLSAPAPAMVFRSLKEIENMLRNKGFFRVHHSYVVNLNYMERYLKGDGGEIIMNDGSCIPVSRHRKQDFMERIERL
ncbi:MULTISPECIES: LytTR family DNA-binding domain-containing protein [unclassified Chitinophaga]|uniref:LytR/AlgR family response regulator transcription factor n=1 Tax=unclassified Chitinophaga TaxID=2619133 RepID=UPI0009D25E61|nr:MULTISPECIES: LytTR family DNA-binding domain-containing protein [unclassified Chitinophaga]OMP79821.1 DNA-binding response regulator [[Flexibacter] sp. ATCC 35208]WPV68615.1 LytTR family DNA-binding domain-containing protein [Chitinophaga sp. LS1]